MSPAFRLLKNAASAIAVAMAACSAAATDPPAASPSMGRPGSGAHTESYVLENDRAGKVVFTTPVDWEPRGMLNRETGSTSIVSRAPAVGLLEIGFNDAARSTVKAATIEEMQANVTKALENFVPRSVEGKVTPVLFRGENTVVYATVTNRAPNPDEPRYVTVGYARSGDVAFYILLFTNDPGRIPEAVSVLANARRIPS